MTPVLSIYREVGGQDQLLDKHPQSLQDPTQGHLSSHRQLDVVQRWDPPLDHNNHTEMLATSSCNVFG